MHLRRNIRTHPCHRSSSDSSFERDPEQDRWQINELPRCGQYLLLVFWAEVLPTTGLSFRLKIAFLQIYAKMIEIIHKSAILRAEGFPKSNPEWKYNTK